MDANYMIYIYIHIYMQYQHSSYPHIHVYMYMTITGATILQGFYSLSGKTSYHKSHEVSQPRDLMLWLLYHSEFWLVPRQPCCWGARKILERLEKSKPESRGFESSRDLAVRRPTALGKKALVSSHPSQITATNVKIGYPIFSCNDVT